jgi:hypothetical protein
MPFLDNACPISCIAKADKDTDEKRGGVWNCRCFGSGAARATRCLRSTSAINATAYLAHDLSTTPSRPARETWGLTS